MNKKTSKTDFIRDALSERKDNNRFRSIRAVEPILGTSKVKVNNKELINFCSNDYLGLSSHAKVIDRANEFSKKYGAGSGASRLVSGSLSIHRQLEDKMAKVLGCEAVLLFNSGFQANTTILLSIADRNSLILADKKCHNSLIQGAVLSRAEFKRFVHNDLNHLESLLKEAASKSYNRILIVSETVFSMDGDQNDLTGLIKLADTYDAFLYSDDAHALGVLGTHGLGLNFGKEGINVSIGTFGKAFGSFGAFIACTSELKNYLINFCPGFIYTTALPPTVIGSIDAALDLIPTMDKVRDKLLKNVNYLRNALKQLGFDTADSSSQILPIIIGSEEKTKSLSAYLEDHGIWALAIRPPTVEQNASRIRITITAKHSIQDIDHLLTTLAQWKEK